VTPKIGHGHRMMMRSTLWYTRASRWSAVSGADESRNMRLTSVISEPIPKNLGTIWYFARRQFDLLALVLALTKEPASRGYWILWHHLSLCSALLVRATNEMKSTDVFLQGFW